MDLVSVIIPTRKRPRDLGRAIHSVIAQTYTNWQLIVVDDNNEGGEFRKETERLMDRYASDSRIVYLKHERSRGGAAARNTGIRCSTGAYVAFLDDDDEWLPTKLEEQVACFESAGDDVALVYTGINNVDRGLGIEQVQLPKYRGRLFKRLLESNFIGTTSTVMCRRRALLEVGLFDERLAAAQDWELYIGLAAKYAFDFVGKPLVLYTKHEGERISGNLRGKIQAFDLLLEKYRETLEQNPRARSLLLQRQGKLLIRLNEMRRAEEKFSQAFRVYPLNSEVLAQLLLSKGGGKYYHPAKNISRSFRHLFKR